MTNCTPNTLSFSPLFRKKVEGNFAGGCITSDAGGLLLREVDKKCNLLAPLDKLMSDQRHQGYVNHSVGAMLKQRVYAIALGYEDVNDHNHLRKDLAFQTMVGRDINLASSATLSRFENSATRADCLSLSQQIVEQFIVSKAVPTLSRLL